MAAACARCASGRSRPVQHDYALDGGGMPIGPTIRPSDSPGGIIPLHPESLTPSASLNRVRIVDLPGIALEESIRGKTAYDLLAARTLAGDVRRHADALGLGALRAAPDTILLPAFARCFTADAAPVRSAADSIARRFGRSLGLLVLTLKRGDAINRRARPDWDDTYWDHWAGIGTIWLGGGLANGSLGACIQHHAAVTITDDEEHACVLQLAAHPSLLPLIGAARGVPSGGGAALAFDFGQSAVKRALALYGGGALVALHLLPSLPAPATFSAGGDDLTFDLVRDLADRMVAVMVDTWRGVASPGRALAPLLVASIAGYSVDGQPLPRQGGPYSQLHRLSDNAAQWLAYQVSQRIGRPLDVALIHDGTAAARTYAGAGHAAVIMMGTTLGVGFVPADGARRPVAPNLVVRGWGGHE